MKSYFLASLLSILLFLFAYYSHSNLTINESNLSLKSVKSKDTLISDTIKLNLTLIKEVAYASYYHDKFTGKKTASGKIFNNNALTCAHKTLPFGTILRVTSKKTNKSVDVTVTDRGPFHKTRDIDLSKKAFMNIAPTKYAGSIQVKLEKIVN